MTSTPRPTRSRFPLTWTFHRNTSRWTFNTLDAGEESVPTPGKELPGLPYLALPPAELPANPLCQVIGDRLSCRQYLRSPARLEDLAVLARGAYGVKGRSLMREMELIERTVPSGGGMYPLELYVLVSRVTRIQPGVYHYVPLTHGLECIREVALPEPFLAYLFMGQEFVTDAAFLVVITAVLDRSMRKYGDRGYRYVLFEAGHAAQNLNLVATAAGLGTCNLGGFFDNELGQLLRLDVEQEVPLYAVAAGVPQESGGPILREMTSRTTAGERTKLPARARHLREDVSGPAGTLGTEGTHAHVCLRERSR